MKVHCAPWAKVCPASSLAQHMGWLSLGWQPIAKKQGSLAVDAPWRRSGRLRPADGDGWWGTAARARGGGEGPIRGGRGGGVQRGLTRCYPQWCGSARRSRRRGLGPGVSEWSVAGYASEQSSWGWQRGHPWLEAAVHMEALTVA
jgi:hypothetical protein